MRALSLFMLSLAFAASVQASFKEVEWIKSPGGIQLNTGYVPSCTDTFEMKVMFSTVADTQTLWCSRESQSGSDNSKTMSAFLINSDKRMRFDRNTGTMCQGPACETNVTYTVVVDYKACTGMVNNTSIAMSPKDATTFTPCAFVFLFASYEKYDYVTNVRNWGKYRLYRFTVRDESGRVIRDYVPVKDDETGAFGLFEKVTRHFYSGIGGSFTGAEPADGAATYELRASSGDVMADAVCWLRGGSDFDGDGKIGAAGELNDMAIGKRGVSLVGNPEGTRFRTERVHYNYLNVTRDESCLYLPQPVTTNVVDDGGTVKTNLTCNPNKIIVSGVFANGTKELNGDYSVFVRFRPDTAILALETMHNWLVRIGMDWGNNRGLLLGLTGKDPNARHLIIYAGQQQWILDKDETRFPVGPDSWYEILLTVQNGRTLTVFTCRNGWTFKSYSWTLSEENLNTAAFARSSALEFGTESDSGGNSTYTIGGSQPGNEWKAFRGSINQAAAWNRALTPAEARAVFAYPRAAVMRLGIENGQSSEFENTAPAGAPVCADACLWTNAAPTLAAGGSYDIHFTLSEADATCPQILRLVTLPSPLSGSGCVQVSVNGHAVKSGALLKPDAEQHVFVAADCFVQGDNVLTLTRSDAGADVVAFDALELTGSWRIGVGNGTEQFSQEGTVPADFYVTDGTWKHMTRAVSPSYWDKDAIRIHFTVPRGFAERYDYRYDFVVAAGKTDMLFKITLNDTEIYRTPPNRIQWLHNTLPYIRIPRGVLKDGEDNVIAIRSLEGVPSGTWESFCRHRLCVREREGILLIFR